LSLISSVSLCDRSPCFPSRASGTPPGYDLVDLPPAATISPQPPSCPGTWFDYCRASLTLGGLTGGTRAMSTSRRRCDGEGTAEVVHPVERATQTRPGPALRLAPPPERLSLPDASRALLPTERRCNPGQACLCGVLPCPPSARAFAFVSITPPCTSSHPSPPLQPSLSCHCGLRSRRRFPEPRAEPKGNDGGECPALGSPHRSGRAWPARFYTKPNERDQTWRI
jgi:hypothetical protein